MSNDLSNYYEKIKALKSSPLFHMSLGAMELFHSNFWRWLMEYNVKYVKVFFKDLENVVKEEIKIKREYKHTDISIEVNGKYYLIENKIKSLVDEEQLERYADDFKDNFIEGKYIFPFEVVLEKEKNKSKWGFLNYNTILDDIDDITDSIIKESKEEDINYNIIKEYTNMTRNLMYIIDYAIKEFYGNKFILANKNDELYNSLIDIRIYDIVRKINCSLLKKKLEERLKKEFNDLYEKITIEQGFSNGQASLSARWKIQYDDEDESKGHFLIGPQLQDRQFKTMIHICTKYFGIENLKSKSKKTIDDTLEKMYHSVEQDIFRKYESYYKSRFKKEYNEYKGNHDKFEYVALYKYNRVDNYKNNDCEIDLSNFDNLCNEFIESLKLFKDVDRDKLIKSIKDGLA